MSHQKQKACLLCQRPADHKYRPFCSKACADIDLDHWLNGRYQISDKKENDKEEPSV